MDKQARTPTVSEVQHSISGQNERMYQAGVATVMLMVTAIIDERLRFALLECTAKTTDTIGYGNADEIELMASAYASGVIRGLKLDKGN